MFGLGDHNQHSNDDPAMLDNVKQLASQPADQVEPPQSSVVATATSDDSALQQHVAEPVQISSTPSASSDDGSQDASTSVPVADEESDPTEAISAPAELPEAKEVSSSSSTHIDEDETPAPTKPAIDQAYLASLKKEALEHLEPVADHLGGTPEETFRATMMMIQANDNHMLLDKALAAAKLIEDDKKRAQAMLDIINEINYFSQNS